MMDFFTYPNDATDARVPFDPRRHRAGICMLCDDRAAFNAIFFPRSDSLHRAVMVLHGHSIRPDTEVTCLVYGLCARHAADPTSLAAVEKSILAMAKSRLQ